MKDNKQQPNQGMRMMPGRRGGGPMHGRMMMEKPKDTKKTIKRLLGYLSESKKILYGLSIVVAIISLLSLLSPVLQGNAIDAITITENKLHVDFDKLYLNLGVLVITVVFVLILQYFQGILSAYLSQRTVLKMRKDLFSKVEKLPIKYLDTHPHGDVMSRMTNDVDNISNTISQSIASIISCVLSIVGSFALMLYYNVLLTLISMVSIVFTLLFTKTVSKYMRKYFIRQQQLLGSINSTVEEMVSGYKTISAYTKEEDVLQTFNDRSSEYKNVAIKANIIGSLMGPVMNLISNVGFISMFSILNLFSLLRKASIGSAVSSAAGEEPSL